MSIIHTGETSEATGLTEVFCPACRAVVGWYSGGEISEMLRAGLQPWCFDCDEVRASEIPPVIMPKEGECVHIILGGVCETRIELVKGKLEISAGGSDGYGVTESLSSSPYLPKGPSETKEVGGNG